MKRYVRGVRDRRAWWQAVLAGGVYVLVFQVAFYLMPFTTETLWIWAFGITEAIENEQVIAFVTSWEWWLAFVFPVSVFCLGALSWYSARVDGNYVPGMFAFGLVGALYLTEIVFVGRYEYALLYIVSTPVVALVAIASHFLPRVLDRYGRSE